MFEKKKIIGLLSVNKTVGCLDPSIKNSYSVSVYFMAVHSLISVESLSSAGVNSLELRKCGSFYLIHREIVIMLRRCQSLRRHTWHKMVGWDLEECLIIVQ